MAVGIKPLAAQRNQRFPFWHLFRRSVRRRSGESAVRTAAGQAGDAAAPAAEASPAETVPAHLRRAPDTYVFDLAPTRSRLGESWDRFGPSIHRMAHRLLFRTLDDKGTFRRYGDAYAISFNRLRGAQARQAGERLYSEFLKLLASGKGMDLLAGDRASRGRAGAATPQPGFFRRLVRRLRSLFRRGEPATDPVGAEIDDTEEEDLAGDAQDLSQAASRQQRDHAPPRTAPARRVRGRVLPPSNPDAEWKTPRKSTDHLNKLKLLSEARALEDAIARTVLLRQGEWSVEMANRYFPPPDLSFIYRPMWNLRSRHLTTYTSVPVCWKNSMEVLHGEDIVPPPRRPENLFELDARCLCDTLETIGRLMVQKQPVLFMSLVHASTLVHEETEKKFIAALETIPQRACRQIIFEIADIAQYAHTAEALRMVRRLQPFCRAVTASVGLHDRSFAFWKQCGIMAVGVDIGRDHRPEAEIMGDLTIFASQAKRQRLSSYLRELSKYSLTISAAAAGFDFLEGAAIGSCEAPEELALEKFDVEDLYTKRVEVVWAD